MQIQYEVNNFSIVSFLSKVEFLSLSMVWIWPIYSLQMERKMTELERFQYMEG
jgi:hypothetical protein